MKASDLVPAVRGILADEEAREFDDATLLAGLQFASTQLAKATRLTMARSSCPLDIFRRYNLPASLTDLDTVYLKGNSTPGGGTGEEVPR